MYNNKNKTYNNSICQKSLKIIHGVLAPNCNYCIANIYIKSMDTSFLKVNCKASFKKYII